MTGTAPDADANSRKIADADEEQDVEACVHGLREAIMECFASEAISLCADRLDATDNRGSPQHDSAVTAAAKVHSDAATQLIRLVDAVWCVRHWSIFHESPASLTMNRKDMRAHFKQAMPVIQPGMAGRLAAAGRAVGLGGGPAPTPTDPDAFNRRKVFAVVGRHLYPITDSRPA
jgi:hypothetical protein